MGFKGNGVILGQASKMNYTKTQPSFIALNAGVMNFISFFDEVEEIANCERVEPDLDAYLKTLQG